MAHTHLADKEQFDIIVDLLNRYLSQLNRVFDFAKQIQSLHVEIINHAQKLGMLQPEFVKAFEGLDKASLRRITRSLTKSQRRDYEVLMALYGRYGGWIGSYTIANIVAKDNSVVVKNLTGKTKGAKWERGSKNIQLICESSIQVMYGKPIRAFRPVGFFEIWSVVFWEFLQSGKLIVKGCDLLTNLITTLQDMEFMKMKLFEVSKSMYDKALQTENICDVCKEMRKTIQNYNKSIQNTYHSQDFTVAKEIFRIGKEDMESMLDACRQLKEGPVLKLFSEESDDAEEALQEYQKCIFIAKLQITNLSVIMFEFYPNPEYVAAKQLYEGLHAQMQSASKMYEKVLIDLKEGKITVESASKEIHLIASALVKSSEGLYKFLEKMKASTT